MENVKPITAVPASARPENGRSIRFETENGIVTDTYARPGTKRSIVYGIITWDGQEFEARTFKAAKTFLDSLS